MVKEIKAYKNQFFKNDDANGGAMAYVIKQCPANHIVVKSWTPKYKQMWGHMTPNLYLKFLEKNYGIYEVIKQFPHKLYFDIDRHLDGTETDIEVYLDQCIQNVKRYFPEGDWAVSGSVTEKKQSYHLISTAYVIHSKEERDIVKIIAKKLDFDTKVYGSNQNLKSINQSKLDGRVQEVIMIEDMKAHSVNCFITDYPIKIDIDFPEDIKEEIHIEKSKKTFDIGTLPKLNIPCPNNINWEQITANDVLGLLPCAKEHSFEYSHKVARFCHTNGITIEMFLSWIEQKRPVMTKDFIEKWKYHWANLHKFPPCSIETIKPILAFYYPDIKHNIHFRQFKNLFQFPTTPNIQHTEIERLNTKHYKSDVKATILHLGMGMGKTAVTIDYLKEGNYSFCWIGHRQSLHQNTYQRIKAVGLECVDYQTGNSKTKGTIYNDAIALAICLNSLHYVDTKKEFNVVVVDEMESLLDAFMGDFMKEKKSSNFNNFVRLLKSAKKIVLLDAFITNRTLSFIQAVEPNIKIEIVSCKVVLNKKIIFHNTVKECEHEFDDITDAKLMSLNKICDQLNADNKCFVFYPFKKDMPELVETIKIRTGKQVISYNADVGDETKATLKDVNKHWSDYDCVVTNTCITCGVNFDLERFDMVWLFLAGFVKPRESIQVSARIRHLKTNIINVSFLGNLKNPTCYIDDTMMMNNPIYNNIYDNFLIEDKAPRRKAFEVFCNKAGYRLSKADMLVNTEICKEMAKIFNNVNVGFSYDKIDTIEISQAEYLENLVVGHNATMYDKLMLQKFYFRKNYTENADESTLSFAWDGKLTYFLKQLEMMMGTDNVFKKIQKENGWDTILPPEKLPKLLKMSNEIIEDIFKEYKFRTLSKSSGKNQIYRDIFNTITGTQVIRVFIDANKHAEYSVNPDIEQMREQILDLIRNCSVSNPVVD